MTFPDSIDSEIIRVRRQIREAQEAVVEAKLELADRREALARRKTELEELLDELERPGERYPIFERERPSTPVPAPNGNGNGQAKTKTDWVEEAAAKAMERAEAGDPVGAAAELDRSIVAEADRRLAERKHASASGPLRPYKVYRHGSGPIGEILAASRSEARQEAERVHGKGVTVKAVKPAKAGAGAS